MSATFWPCPIAWEDAPTVAALAVALHDPDASIYALRLWHHRRRCGATLTGPHARAVVEVVCRWRRKAGRLADALLSAGLVREVAGGLEILAWEDVAVVDWTRSGEDDVQELEQVETKEAPVPVEDAKARTRRLARERQQRARGGKRGGIVTDSVTDRDDRRDGERDESRSERDAGVTRHGDGVTERDESGQDALLSPRARTCATETDTETETEKLSDAVASAASPVTGTSTEGRRVRSKARRAKPEDPQLAPDRVAYLARFREVFRSPAADFTRGGVFTFSRLRTKHGMPVLLKALDTCAADDWTRTHRTLSWVCSQDGIDFGSRRSSQPSISGTWNARRAAAAGVDPDEQLRQFDGPEAA